MVDDQSMIGIEQVTFKGHKTAWILEVADIVRSKRSPKLEPGTRSRDGAAIVPVGSHWTADVQVPLAHRDCSLIVSHEPETAAGVYLDRSAIREIAGAADADRDIGDHAAQKLGVPVQ